MTHGAHCDIFMYHCTFYLFSTLLLSPVPSPASCCLLSPSAFMTHIFHYFPPFIDENLRPQKFMRFFPHSSRNKLYHMFLASHSHVGHPGSSISRASAPAVRSKGLELGQGHTTSKPQKTRIENDWAGHLTSLWPQRLIMGIHICTYTGHEHTSTYKMCLEIFVSL